MITLNDIDFSNKKFWTGFVTTSFPTAIEEETIEENKAADINWWSNFF